MNLEEFVSSALTQITKGIISAQAATKPIGAEINPPTTRGDSAPKNALQVHSTTHGLQVAQVISFDLAVTVREASTAGGQGGIQVLGLKFGGNLGAEESTSSQSKISFSIPVLWPIQKREG